MTHEIRAADLRAETRDDGAMVLAGYAAIYDTETVIAGMFRESIAPGAFTEAVARDDVRALFNHDPNVVLGRTVSGTLRLDADGTGLRYEVTLNPADAEHQRVWQMVARGDVSQSSFGFEVEAQEWRDTGTAGTLPLRVIRSAKLYDVSPVTYPAYAQTTVTARDLPSAAADAAQALADSRVRGYAAVLARRAWLDAREAA